MNLEQNRQRRHSNIYRRSHCVCGNREAKQDLRRFPWLPQPIA
ncbi:hypothetical protein [Chroococcidiopsis cubana]|nr:hypothetical protein [Chroococcidiopsis cubana]